MLLLPAVGKRSHHGLWRDYRQPACSLHAVYDFDIVTPSCTRRYNTVYRPVAAKCPVYCFMCKTHRPTSQHKTEWPPTVLWRMSTIPLLLLDPTGLFVCCRSAVYSLYFLDSFHKFTITFSSEFHQPFVWLLSSWLAICLTLHYFTTRAHYDTWSKLPGRRRVWGRP